jgi:hypothetical protein
VKNLFLSLPTNQIFIYPNENKKICNIFSPFENMINFDLQNLDLNFKFPENILVYDEKMTNFLKNVFKLQYIYYQLKTSQNLMKNHELNPKNIYEELALHRFNLT